MNIINQKRLRTQLLFFIFIILVSCNKLEDNNQMTTNEAPVSEELQREPLQTKIGTLEASTEIMIVTANTETLVSIFPDFKAKGYEEARIYQNEKGLYILELRGAANNKYVTAATTLTLIGNEFFRSSNSCTQKCESENGCNGCTLNITSSCSGSCWCNSGSGNCKHTVESGGDGSAGAN